MCGPGTTQYCPVHPKVQFLTLLQAVGYFLGCCKQPQEIVTIKIRSGSINTPVVTSLGVAVVLDPRTSSPSTAFCLTLYSPSEQLYQFSYPVLFLSYLVGASQSLRLANIVHFLSQWEANFRFQEGWTDQYTPQINQNSRNYCFLYVLYQYGTSLAAAAVFSPQQP